MSPEVEQLVKMKRNVDLVSGQLRFEGSALEIIRELYELLPADVTLTAFEFEDGDHMLIRGNADELGKVFEVPPALERSQYFSNVGINFATNRQHADRTYVDFEIIAGINKAY